MIILPLLSLFKLVDDILIAIWVSKKLDIYCILFDFALKSLNYVGFMLVSLVL